MSISDRLLDGEVRAWSESPADDGPGCAMIRGGGLFCLYELVVRPKRRMTFVSLLIRSRPGRGLPLPLDVPLLLPLGVLVLVKLSSHSLLLSSSSPS